MSNTDQLKKELKNETASFIEHPSAECWCPRCGEELLESETILNPNSKQIEGVLICESCRVEEGELLLYNKTLPLQDWAYFE